MIRFEKVAVPVASVSAEVVPDNTPPPGFEPVLPKARLTGNEAIAAPELSSNRTWTAGEIGCPTVDADGWVTKDKLPTLFITNVNCLLVVAPEASVTWTVKVYKPALLEPGATLEMNSVE